MSKMTDKEIIQALEDWIKNFDGKATDFMTLNLAYDLINRQQKQLDNYSHNVRNLAKDFIDQQKIINRQQAEIEKLTINMNAFGLGMKREKERADTIRAEAIKEFADELIFRLRIGTWKHKNILLDECVSKLDNLVKEMVGEGK